MESDKRREIASDLDLHLSTTSTSRRPPPLFLLPLSPLHRPAASSPPSRLSKKQKRRIAHTLWGSNPRPLGCNRVRNQFSKGSKPSALIHCAKGAAQFFFFFFARGGPNRVTFSNFRAFMRDWFGEKKREKEEKQLFYLFRDDEKKIKTFFQSQKLYRNSASRLRANAFWHDARRRRASRGVRGDAMAAPCMQLAGRHSSSGSRRGRRSRSGDNVGISGGGDGFVDLGGGNTSPCCGQEEEEGEDPERQAEARGQARAACPEGGCRSSKRGGGVAFPPRR